MFSSILFALASVAAFSGTNADGVPHAHDVSFLQASLEFHQATVLNKNSMKEPIIAVPTKENPCPPYNPKPFCGNELAADIANTFVGQECKGDCQVWGATRWCPTGDDDSGAEGTAWGWCAKDPTQHACVGFNNCEGDTPCEVGDEVLAEYANYGSYDAKITSKGSGKITVAWNDGDTSHTNIDANKVTKKTLKDGLFAFLPCRTGGGGGTPTSGGGGGGGGGAKSTTGGGGGGGSVGTNTCLCDDGITFTCACTNTGGGNGGSTTGGGGGGNGGYGAGTQGLIQTAQMPAGYGSYTNMPGSGTGYGSYMPGDSTPPMYGSVPPMPPPGDSMPPMYGSMPPMPPMGTGYGSYMQGDSMPPMYGSMPPMPPMPGYGGYGGGNGGDGGYGNYGGPLTGGGGGGTVGTNTCPCGDGTFTCACTDTANA